MEKMSAVIRNLKQRREERQLLQRDVNDILNLPQDYISNLESGEINLDLSYLEKVAQFLGFELMLVPMPLASSIQVTIDNHHVDRTPRWQPDEIGNTEVTATQGWRDDQIILSANLTKNSEFKT